MVSNKNSYFIIACRAFHAYMCNGIIYLDHTPCYPHDYTAKVMEIILDTYSS